MKKLYSISRIKLFEIISAFPSIDFQLVEAGELFASVFLTEKEAHEITCQFPFSVSKL